MKTMHDYFSVIKLWVFNIFAIMFSLSDYQDGVKLLILVLTAGYTARKWYLMERNKNKKDE